MLNQVNYRFWSIAAPRKNTARSEETRSRVPAWRHVASTCLKRLPEHPPNISQYNLQMWLLWTCEWQKAKKWKQHHFHQSQGLRLAIAAWYPWFFREGFSAESCCGWLGSVWNQGSSESKMGWRYIQAFWHFSLATKWLLAIWFLLFWCTRIRKWTAAYQHKEIHKQNHRGTKNNWPVAPFF